MAESKRRTSSKTVNSIKQLPYADLSSRGIRPEIAEHFNVRMSRSEEDGLTPTAIYFPYYDQRGSLCGWKVKDLTVAKNDEFHYTTIGKVGVDCKLFGQKESEHNSTRRKRVYYVEGEEEVLTFYQVAIDKIASTKWAGKIEPHVVSVSCGCGNAVDATIHNQDYLESFDEIVIAFDADEATPKELKKGIMRGKEATEAVASHLMGHNILIGHMPDGCKDGNIALMDGRADELYNNLCWNAKKYVAEKIIPSSMIPFESLIEERPEGVYVDGFPKLMEMVCGFRKRELSVLTALSGAGKSSVVASWAHSLANNGYRVGMIFLEEEDRETAQRILAQRLKVPYNKFKKNPLKYKSKEEIEEAYRWMTEDDRFVFLDHFGSLKTEELLGKVKAMLYLHKVDFIFLDHLSMVVSGSKSDNERKDLDILMTELAAFVAANDVGILAVSHLNRDAAEEIKGISRLEEPMWIKVKKENLRGSASLEQLSWMVFGIDLEIMPDRTRGRIRLTCLKNRPHGNLGEADIVKMNPVTGILEDASDEVYLEEGESIEF